MNNLNLNFRTLKILFLANAFRDHPNLKEIDMRHNLLGDETGFCLIDMMRKNTRITKLSLEMNSIKWDYLNEISKLIKRNTSLFNAMRAPQLQHQLNDLENMSMKPTE